VIVSKMLTTSIKPTEVSIYCAYSKLSSNSFYI